VTDEHIPLGRLVFEELDVDERLAELGKLRKLDISEYDKPLYYKNSEFWDLLVTYSLELLTKENEKEIIKYFDLPRFFEGLDERIEELQEKQPPVFLTCIARDLLDRGDIEAGITDEQLAVFEYEGRLWEIDPLYLYDFGSKDHPWADFLKPLGVFELLGEIDLEERLRDV
jgi:hypothetical protein